MCFLENQPIELLVPHLEDTFNLSVLINWTIIYNKQLIDDGVLHNLTEFFTFTKYNLELLKMK